MHRLLLFHEHVPLGWLRSAQFIVSTNANNKHTLGPNGDSRGM